MSSPLQLSPGLVFDTRSVVIAISGLFGGPITAIITALTSSIYRIWLGGVGVPPGIATAVVSGAIGVLFYYWRKRWTTPSNPAWFYLFGLLVHGAMLLCMFTLPQELAWQTIRKMALPVMIIFPVVTLLLAMLLAELEKQIQTERRMRESEKQFRILFEQAVDAIFVSDFDGNLRDVNQASCASLGYSREELLKLRVQDVDANFPSQEMLQQFWKERLKDGKPSTFESVHRRKDGSTFPVEIRAGFIEYSSQPLVLGLSRDISERQEAELKRKKLEAELHQAKKMESIGLMAGGVAHDLNNILSGIVGYPELLLNDLPEDSKLRKPIEAIKDSGSRAAAIVADLLTVARGVASTRKLQDLNSLTQEYLNSPEHKTLVSLYPKITFKHQLTAARPQILCSSVHVKKCLMNLVTNASEAVDDSGMVFISTKNQSVEEDTAAEYRIKSGEYIVLEVCDNGHGIKKKDLDRIFEPFYTKKLMGRSGTGLGLTVVWNTMNDHNGIVLVENGDKGTCFKLFFPVGKEIMPTPSGSNDIENLTGNGEHILLVDDELYLRDIGSQMLQHLGYKVDSVSSGELAVQFIKNNPVDLIVLDMLMEPGMNGRQTFEEIIKLYPDQKAVVASGYSESEDVKATLKLGAGGFIMKPYSTVQFGRVIKDVLKG